MKLNDILSEGVVRSYHMEDWSEHLGIPKEFIELYGVTGDDQRGRPEIAMTSVQKVHSGVLNFVVEHIGDISNRASPMHSFGFAQGEAAGKAKKVLAALRHGYGFSREHQENISSNAKYNNISVEEHTKLLNDKLQVYADEHRKLAVYNRPQELARNAAVAVGEKRFDAAAELLEDYLRIAGNEETFTASMKAYYNKPR